MACRPEPQVRWTPTFRENCLAFSRRAAFEGQSLIANLMGATMVRRLVPGSEEARRARELRRHYAYAGEMREQRSAEQIRAADDPLMGLEMVQYPELEAIKRGLDRAGILRDPPADWQPSNPVALMTGDQRDAYRAAMDAQRVQVDSESED